MSGNTAGKDKLKSIDKNQCVPRMKKMRGRIVTPAMSTAQIKASDERRKAEEELQRRKAEVQKHTGHFLQDCIDEEKVATPYVSDDSDGIPVMGEAVPSGFGQKDWMEKRGLPYGGDDLNSWTKKRAAADGKESLPDADAVDFKGQFLQAWCDEKKAYDKKQATATANAEGKQSATTYTRSHLQVDEKDCFDKNMVEGKEPSKPEDGMEEKDYDLFQGNEEDRAEYCKYWARVMFARHNKL